MRAFAGTHVVLLGMDVDEAARPGLLGFAIHCRDKTAREEYWLDNLRIFRESRPEGLEADPGTALAAHAAASLWDPGPRGIAGLGGRYLTSDNPIQAFRWGDYGASPGHQLTYRVVAMYGAPGALTARDAVEVDVTTESPGAGTHDVYFNRGVLASQRYVQLFGDRPPSEVPEALEWLSHGLEEALLGFLAQATDERFGLRAAVYEFNHAPAVAAFAAARDRGVDVRIVYDAKAGKGKPGTQSRKAIREAGIGTLTIPRRANPSYISHNKFIVLTRDGEPIAVWTGSTNLTAGGLYGQSNVGHVARDPQVAAKYLAYWEQLAQDPEGRELRAWNEENSPLVPGGRLFPVFSPRRSLAALEAAAQRLSDAGSTAFLTAAFGVNKELMAALDGHPSVLRYVLLERDHGDVVLIERSADNQAAAGASISKALGRWVRELNPKTQGGLNHWVYFIHDKFMLLDALGSDPLLITGSANFSDASTKKNDENMLVIRGDTRVVDIYLGEFLRLFTHYRFRARLQELARATPEEVDKLSYLDPTDGWTAPAYQEGSREKEERLAFAHPDG